MKPKPLHLRGLRAGTTAIVIWGISTFSAHAVDAPTQAAAVVGRPAISVRLLGEAEVVIPAAAMTCASASASDVPDMPPAAFRQSDGEVVLLASNRQNYIARGPNLQHVRRAGCERLLAPAGNGDPSTFRDQEWVTGVAPLSPTLAVGAVHDEYHGDLHGQPQCPPRRQEKLCWYASSTLIVSEDGGRTFRRPPAPANVLAAPVGRYIPGQERVSLGVPKLLRRGPYLYAFAAFADRNRGVQIQQCLFRASVDAPLDWRAWDGQAFVLKRGSAYADSPPRDCQGVLSGNVTSVKFVPARNLFIALVVNRNTVSYVTSVDMIHWSAPGTLRGFSPFGQFDQAVGSPDWYFSLLDPTSKSAAFDTLEGQPYLYFVRFHTAAGKILPRSRDVMRQRVSIG